MAVIDFPNPPLTLNQSFAASNGITYKWNGTMWVTVPSGGSGGSGITEADADLRYVNVAGDTMTGDLSVGVNGSLGDPLAHGVGLYKDGWVSVWSNGATGIDFEAFSLPANQRLWQVWNPSIAGGPLRIEALLDDWSAQASWEFNRDGSTTLPAMNSSAIAALDVTNTGINGAGIHMLGNGAVTPGKFIRVNSGDFQIVNSSYSGVPLSLTDAGALTITGALTGTTAEFSSTGAFGGTLRATGNTTLNWAAPATSFPLVVRTGTDKVLEFRPGIVNASAATISAVNDLQNALVPLEFFGSVVNVAAPLTGTTATFSTSLTVDTATSANAIVLGVFVDLPSFNMLTLNSDTSLNGAQGLAGGADAHLYHLAQAGGDHIFRAGGVEKARISSAGALTGTTAVFSGSVDASAFSLYSPTPVLALNDTSVGINKFLVNDEGSFKIANSAFSQYLFTLTDAGAATLIGPLTGTSATMSTAIPATSNDTTVATTGWIRSNSAKGEFYATSAIQAITTAYQPLIFVSVVLGNTGGTYYSTSTGRWTPPAGRYVIFAHVTATVASTATTVTLSVYKNGITYGSSSGSSVASGTLPQGISITAIVDANGTDYFDLRVIGSPNAANTTTNCFGGYPIR